MSKDQLKERSDLLGAVMERASEDSEFRAAVLADPQAALAKEFGLPAREGMNIVVHENTADTIHLPLPTAPAVLDEGELASVAAGGWDNACVWNCNWG